jgi:hypothetical protein
MMTVARSECGEGSDGFHMTTPEHLDPEACEPDQLPAWEPWDDEDWWMALDDGQLAELGYRRQADLRTAPGVLDWTCPNGCGHDDDTLHDEAGCERCDCPALPDEQRPADFDDEERRP